MAEGLKIHPASPRSPEAEALLDRLSDALAGLTGDSGRNSFDPTDVEQDGALFVLARDGGGTSVGCGAFRPLGPDVAEIKRMFAAPDSRGVGAAILAHLESAARDAGYREVWLETRLVNARAVSFYEEHGYRRIENFGKYADWPEAVCFAKMLAQ
jgi:ribosomal protein S18 acetylase RimI-like enzyme